ncbi:MAG: amidohydrolase family protein, partial [Phycisphaerales bacterium]|nr:amidohydrolase family protein [Phycisphaerales bacterium]
MPAPDTGVITRNTSNLHAQDYAAGAETLGPPIVPITDVHSHINGTRAAALFAGIAELYGVERIYSMTRLEHVDGVREILGDRIRFIATPDFRAEDKAYAFGRGYVDSIEKFHAKGARITKFWVAPRSRDIAAELGDPQLFRLDSPYTRDAIACSRDLGMMFMVHCADPDTWFSGKYSDASKYGTKRGQYEPFELLMEAHRDVPWIAAHMGGWPEDLEFLTALLGRHPNLYLDTSAAK